jgi:hypothetical protein
MIPCRHFGMGRMQLPWSEPVARTVCDALLARAGLSGYYPQLISFRQTAIFHIPGPDISLRIYGPAEDQARAMLMVTTAQWLEARNFPAVRLSPIETAQPFNLLGYQTSVWEWVVADEPSPDSPFAYGRPLRWFHDLPATDAPSVPVFDQMTRIRQRLDKIRAAHIVPKARQCSSVSLIAPPRWRIPCATLNSVAAIFTATPCQATRFKAAARW